MGAYLSEPIVEKISEDEKNEYVVVGSSSMQGWRRNQEDAHNCILDFDGNTSFFAVYDGHGGAEVAIYCSEKFPEFLKALQTYAQKKYEQALKDAFIGFDATLLREDVVEILKKMAQEKNGDMEDEDDDDEEDLNELCQEGALPLHKVLEKYKESGGKSLPQICKLKDEAEPTAGGSGTKPKPQSPYLRGRRGSQKEDKPEEADENSESAKEIDSSENSKESATNSEAVSSSSGSGSSSSASSAAVKENEVDDKEADSASSPKKEANNTPQKEKEQKKEKDDDDTSTSDSDADFQGDEAGSSTDDCEEASEDDNDDDDDDDDDEEDTSEEDAFCANMIEEPGKDSGCTAVAALLVGRDLYVANAGDSRCVVCRNGSAVDMSMDHKPEDEIESARIIKAGGKVTLDGRVNGGLNLSRAIGDHAYKMNEKVAAEEQMISALPDVKKLTISNEDEFMVLACDGIWNFMSSEEVVKFVKERIDDGKLKMSEICEELFDNCLAPNTLGDGTGCDNMTAVIIKFKPAIFDLPSAEPSTGAENNGQDITQSSNKRTLAQATDEDENNGDDDVSKKRPKTAEGEAEAQK